jgi:hypothetical protein
MSIYTTDPQYKWGAIALLIIGALFIWATPSYWPYVVGFWSLVALIAYLYRNNP